MNRESTIWIVILFLLFLVSLFLNLGSYPLYLEEPRRALIALEMIYRDNMWVPTQIGELYFKKPPMYNWIIMLGYKVFGYSEWGVRFFSVISYIGMGLLTFFAGKKYVNLRFGLISAGLFLVSINTFFYFSTIGEIDLFYSLITLASFYVFFYFIEKGQPWPAYILFYLLSFIGVMTKGFPTLVFIAITLLTYVIHKKRFGELFRMPNITGFLLMASLIAAYVFIYIQYAPVSGLIDGLWQQSRGVDPV